jgi:uracil-DNA glycosylase family 4
MQTTLARFDMFSPIPEHFPEISSVPPVDLNELPTWPEIIDACEGLSYDEAFEVGALGVAWKDYPKGTICVVATGRVYLQPAPTHGLFIKVVGDSTEDIKYTASGVGCQQCPLHKERTMICDGVGPHQPKVAIIAEAPGREEDACGIPFVGRSGQLLKALLSEVGFTPDDYFLTNTVRCRPPENRDPTKAEIAACKFWLTQEMERVKPQSVLLLGRHARESFDSSCLPPNTPIWHLQHPAYLLRNPSKVPAWRRDLAAFAEEIGIKPVLNDPRPQHAPLHAEPWEHGEPAWDADVLAVDTETRSLEDDHRQELVTIQVSDGSRAQLYRPLHNLAGASGPIWVSHLEGIREAREGPSESVLPQVREVPGGGRLTYLSQHTLPELAACDRRESHRQSLAFSGHRRADFTSRRYIYHNVKYDLPRIGGDLRKLDTWEDTALIAYQLRYDRVGLKILGPEITGIPMRPISDLLKRQVQAGVRHPGTNSYQKAQDVWRAQLKIGNSRATEKVVFSFTHKDKEVSEQALKDECARRGIRWEIPHYKWEECDFAEALESRPEDAVAYALTDAVVTARMFPVLYRLLAQEPTLLRHYHEIEKPVVAVVYDMEQAGARIDNTALVALEQTLKDQAEHEKTLAQFWADEDFNPNSGRELARIIEKLGGRLKDKTPTGALKTDKTALLRVCGVESSEDLHEDTDLTRFVGATLRYKGVGKLLSTYVPALKQQDEQGRIHTNFNQMVTDTNRFSSSGPNLQNIPARTGKQFRKVFIARPGHVIVKADFSQLELRIYAHYTREDVLLEAYSGPEERDVHQAFASRWGVDRKIAKNGVFGLVYGVEGRKLAATLGIPQDQTKRFLDQMRLEMPSIAGGWREHISNILAQYGYVETLYGWRNYYPGFRSPLQQEAAKALREAANLPIQGTAGGILKKLLLAYDAWRWRTEAYGSVPILMVHDEVVFEVPERQAAVFGYELQRLVPDINPLSVPLKLEVEIGPNWGECIKLEEWSRAH